MNSYNDTTELFLSFKNTTPVFSENDIRIRKQWFENNDLDFYSKPTDQNFQNFNNKNLENKKDTDLKNENSSEEAEFVQENKCKASDIQENPHVDTVPNKQESEMRNNFYNSYYNDNTNNQVTHTPSSLNNYPSSNPSSQYNTHNNTYNSYNGDADTDANHKDFPTSDASYSLPNDNEYHGQGDNGNGGMKQDGSADDDDRPAWLKEVLEEEARFTISSLLFFSIIVHLVIIYLTISSIQRTKWSV